MKKTKLSLIIPFYNDVGCPIPFVNELQTELKKEKVDYELILVDDCSQDNTLGELKTLEGKNVRVIHNKVNQDYGGAIMAGLAEAKGEILGFTCGDGEVSAKDIVRVYCQMTDRDHILKTVRLNRQDGWQREYISKVFNLWSKIRFKIKIPDINGYPVFFKKECYAGLGGHNVKTNWLFNIDLFRKMIKREYKIRNISVEHKKRAGGKSKMDPIRIVKMVLKYLGYK